MFHNSSESNGEFLLTDVTVPAASSVSRAVVVHVPAFLRFGGELATAPRARQESHKGVARFGQLHSRLATQDVLHLTEGLMAD